jgi:hypothetical protein
LRRKTKLAHIRAKTRERDNNDIHKCDGQPSSGTDANRQPIFPTLLGRLRPAQLDECAASLRSADGKSPKVTNRRHSQQILRLSDCV